jgi:hypothetical protein
MGWSWLYVSILPMPGQQGSGRMSLAAEWWLTADDEQSVREGKLTAIQGR